MYIRDIKFLYNLETYSIQFQLALICINNFKGITHSHYIILSYINI